MYFAKVKKPAKKAARKKLKAATKSASRSTKGRQECYHCKKMLTAEERKTHDCWTTTASALTADLEPDLVDAWERLQEVAESFGEQRSYASHRSIMFSRKSCYFFVRPMKKRLELCFFAGRKIKHPSIRKTYSTTKTKHAHMVFVTHRDQVESPLTNWLQEAYDFCPPQKPQDSDAQKRAARTKKMITFEELSGERPER